MCCKAAMLVDLSSPNSWLKLQIVFVHNGAVLCQLRKSPTLSSLKWIVTSAVIWNGEMSLDMSGGGGGCECDSAPQWQLPSDGVGWWWMNAFSSWATIAVGSTQGNFPAAENNCWQLAPANGGRRKDESLWTTWAQLFLVLLQGCVWPRMSLGSPPITFLALFSLAQGHLHTYLCGWQPKMVFQLVSLQWTACACCKSTISRK